MGTRFRTMLAPIGVSTGDGRRFAAGAITTAPTPFPLEWARSREGGHDGAVVIGAVHEVEPSDDAIWASGVLFDDADRETMPRMAEDVAEALTLIGQGVLGPSVDLDNFEGVPVLAGTDEPISYEDMERVYEETGEEPKIELLVTSGRVRAATLVSIPAFQETSVGFELLSDEEAEPTTAALVASVCTTAPVFSTALFDTPKLDGPTPLTIDTDTGRVYGHVATWRTCHAGYSDVCVTPPRDPSGDYAAFNRHPVTTDGGTVWAGRLTVGGRHPGLALAASATMAEYDGKTVAAYVRASEDEHGIVVSGALSPGLDEDSMRVLSRRKVSGDWRETSAGLSLVELLALSPGPRQHSEPGFPVGTYSVGGRQTALTAAFGPEPGGSVDVTSAVRAALRVEREREAAFTAVQRAVTDDARRVLANTLGWEARG
jgi:hypothetical protein